MTAEHTEPSLRRKWESGVYARKMDSAPPYGGRAFAGMTEFGFLFFGVLTTCAGTRVRLQRPIEYLPNILFRHSSRIDADVAAAEGVFDNGVEVLIGHTGIAHGGGNADVRL